MPETLKLSKLHIVKNPNAEYEVDRLLSFYKTHQHPGNRVRDPLELIKTLKEGSFYIVENRDGEILGAAGTFYHFNSYVEAGGTRVIKEGFGLQKLFHWIRLIHHKFMGEEADIYFSVIARGNDKSIKNTLKSGFREWSPQSHDLAAIGKFWESDEADQKNFYRLIGKDKANAAKRACKNLIDFNKNPILRNKTTSEEIVIVLDIALIQKDSLRDLVERNASSIDDDESSV